MTIQENAAGPQLLMLMTVVVSIGLGIWIAGRLVARRRAGPFVAILAGLLLLYAAALLVVSAASSTTTLKTGDMKCFDEWCATMLDAEAGASQNTLAVQVRLENHGRGAQRSVLARAFVEAAGQRYWPRNPDVLHIVVPGGGSVVVRLVFARPTQLASARFVVTEAASGELTPGLIVIGDESSPFHSIAGWPLNEFGGQVGS
jgi:hypothetical protein